MFEVSKYPHGTFSWADINTSDQAAGKAFYQGLFGWEAEDLPTGREGVTYTMFYQEGKTVAGLGPMDPEEVAQGMPPRWNNYVTVNDIEATAAQVSDLGGTLLMEPFDVLDSGRMAAVLDPTGAVFMLWEARNHIGAELVNCPGAMTWNELATRDVSAAQAFYEGLFGWEFEVDGNDYHSFRNNGRWNGGMMQMTEEWSDLPPHWMVYFSVADIDDAVAKVGALGGRVHVPVTEIEGTGRFAVVADPQGAVFTIIQSDAPQPWEA